MPNSRRSRQRARPQQAAAALGIVDRLFAPTDVASLAFFRIAFGAIMLWEVFRYFVNNWVWYFYIRPVFHFTYHGFEWVKPWPGDGMYVHFLVLGLLAVMIMLGLRYRLAIALFSIGITYVLLLDKTPYLNHLYLICLVSFLMNFVPVHRAFSFDARRDPRLQSDYVPAWTLWLLRFQIAVPYIFGGLVKLNGDWLQGQPMQIWMSHLTELREAIPAFGERWLALTASYAGLAFDLSVVPLLLWRRTRPFAFCAALLFHLLNATMFHIGIFPWFMICATTLFLSPSWPRKLQRQRPVADTQPPSRPAVSILRRRALMLLAGTYVVMQLVVPLRHFLYSGKVDWTEEGSKFAWRMMLHEKGTAIVLMVLRTPVDGRTFFDEPQRYLTPLQVDKMAGDPEMLREFAHFVRNKWAGEGSENVEVRLVVLCSLNGRKPQLLIDPSVDLAAQPRSIWPQPWIMPLVEPLPDEPWNIPQDQWHKHVDLTQLPTGVR